MKENFINLYWWNGIPNIGDIASRYLIEHLSPVPVKWKNPNWNIGYEVKSLIKLLLHRKVNIPHLKNLILPGQRCIFGIGSILDFANKQTVVWGSGYREYTSVFHYCDIRAVRGLLSKAKLPSDKYKNVAIGDPALLLPVVYKPRNNTVKNLLTIIPHYADYDFFSENYSDRFNILDVRTNDVEKFIDSIVSSQYILSSSLHGLIISQAYNVPAIWIKKNYIYSSDFKFHDYFSSVNIQNYSAFTDIDCILQSAESIDTFFKKNSDLSLIKINLNEIQAKLLSSAPFKLNDKYNSFDYA